MCATPTINFGTTFVCDCEEEMRAACVGEPFYKEHEGKRYCVLHSPGKEKSADFENAFQRKLENRNFNFCGVWFPDPLLFHKFDFNGDVNFSRATFSATANFNGATFSAESDFRDATFSGEAEFINCTLSGKTDFSAVTFSAESDFRDATFSGAANFNDATFSAAANFRYARFSAANFNGATFGAAADFREATFSAAADFRFATFHAPGDFSSARFSAESDFSEATFSAWAYFRSVTFSEAATFRDVTFTAAADFRKAAFSAWASFRNATFGAVANLTEATFSGAANFTGATFSGAANFAEATFRASANFRSAIFSGDAEFINCTLSGQADFSYVTFKDYIKFAANERSVFSDTSSLNLQFARIQKPDHLSFHTLGLRPHWFLNVDARKFEFTNVEWHLTSTSQEIKDLNSGGYGISAPAHQLLAIACRHLAVNAEDNHRYEEASRFRYMAMDVRRHERWRGLAFWRLSWWYWLASGYGERVSQAFLMLLGILVLFALLFNHVGFARWDSKLTSETDVVNAKRDDVGAPLKFSRALTYSSSVMAFQKPEPRPATAVAQTVVLLETILGPVQAALLALAIRRKFMR